MDSTSKREWMEASYESRWAQPVSKRVANNLEAVASSAEAMLETVWKVSADRTGRDGPSDPVTCRV